MLPMIVGGVLVFVAVCFAEAGGEARYDTPGTHPKLQRTLRCMALAVCFLALYVARYL